MLTWVLESAVRVDVEKKIRDWVLGRGVPFFRVSWGWEWATHLWQTHPFSPTWAQPFPQWHLKLALSLFLRNPDGLPETPSGHRVSGLSRFEGSFTVSLVKNNLKIPSYVWTGLDDHTEIHLTSCLICCLVRCYDHSGTSLSLTCA